MQDTVDQAHGAVPCTLADIIEGARRPRVTTVAPTPSMGGYSPAPGRRAAPGEVRRGSPAGPAALAQTNACTSSSAWKAADRTR